MRQNQKQTQQLPQNPQQQQQMQMQQNKMLGGPNMKPMDKTMGNMQQMQNLPGQQNKQNQMVIIEVPRFSPHLDTPPLVKSVKATLTLAQLGFEFKITLALVSLLTNMNLYTIIGQKQIVTYINY